MMIALDTNVLVSGLLSPRGAPGRVLDLVIAGAITVCIDNRISAEYREVISRPDWPFDQTDAFEVLEFIISNALHVTPAPLDLHLPDPDDLMFVETAVQAGAEMIVTGNRRHFPRSATRGISVLSPAEFLEALKKK
jgi:putative PIN family toxin of toxin-antitoxin system